MAKFQDTISDAELNAALAGKADAAHTHTTGDVGGLDAALSGKAALSHGHATGDVTGLDAALAGKADAAHSHALDDLSNVNAGAPIDGYILTWNQTAGEWQAQAAPEGGAVAWVDITGKPTSFLPVAHGHAWSEITGKPTFFAPTAHTHGWGEITGKPTTFPPSTHLHALSDLSNVNAGAPTDGYILTWNQTAGEWQAQAAPEGGAVAWADITGKPTTFAPSTHSHSFASLTGIPTTLAGYGITDGGVNRVVVSSAHTAAKEQRIAVDTQAAAAIVTAPAGPSAGDYFFVGDAGSNAAANNITVDFGAPGFEGVADADFVIDINNFGAGFIFVGGTWRLFD